MDLNKSWRAMSSVIMRLERLLFPLMSSRVRLHTFYNCLGCSVHCGLTRSVRGIGTPVLGDIAESPEHAGPHFRCNSGTDIDKPLYRPFIPSHDLCLRSYN